MLTSRAAGLFSQAFLGAWKILFGGVIGKTIIKIFGCAQLAALLPALSNLKESCRSDSAA